MGAEHPRAGSHAVEALDIAVGTGAVLVAIGGRAAGTVAGVVKPPMGFAAGLAVRLVPGGLRKRSARLASLLAECGREERQAASILATAVVRALTPVVVSAVLDQIDLTEMVREHVDLDRVAEGLDVDAVIARVDLDAIVDRLDLVDLADEVAEGIDLPAIIRESTGSMASEAVRGVRLQGMHADQSLAGLVDRVLMRRRGRDVAGPTGAGSGGSRPERDGGT